MNLTEKTQVSQIALSDPGARRILEDAGIDYCCGGVKPLGDACLQANVRPEEILERLRQNHESATPKEAEWTQADLSELTRHIRERHHQYVREAIPRVRALLAKVRARHFEKHPEVEEVVWLFEEVAGEMLMHMQKEEQILFPYIDNLAHAAKEKVKVETPFFETVTNPIHMMMREHDSAGELVRKIRRATSDYSAPADACTAFRATYQELRQFEEDLHLHVHLENNILFPRAIELEAAAV